jgi:hypothetical protein
MRTGSIIDNIITTHIARNEPAAPVHVCPGIRIHAIDIVQPPGIGIPFIDMVVHPAIVSAELIKKSTAETLRNTCCDGRLESIVSDLPFPD